MHALGVLPMMAYMQRLRSKGVHFSSLRVATGGGCGYT